jgi:hypothetical protein
MTRRVMKLRRSVGSRSVMNRSRNAERPSEATARRRYLGSSRHGVPGHGPTDSDRIPLADDVRWHIRFPGGLMRAHITALLCTVLAGAAVGCTGGDPETVVVTQTVTVQPVRSVAPTVPPATARGPLPLGESALVAGGNDRTTITVLAYTHTARGVEPPGAPLGGDTWATVEVKACNSGSAIVEVTQFPWSLAYADATRTKTTGLNGGDLPKPEFAPTSVKLNPTDCVRGNIPFPVTANKRPERIVYTPDGPGAPIDWSVPSS